MGEANITLANDNGDLSNEQLDDRTGFKNFLESFRSETHLAALEQAKADSLQESETVASPFEASLETFKLVAATLLAGLAILSLWLLSQRNDPAQLILAFSGLSITGIGLAYIAENKQNWRVKSLGVLIALLSCFSVVYMLGTYFAVNALNPSQHLFWLALTGFAFAASYALRSRIALLISICMTAVWGYTQFTGFTPLTEMGLLLPIMAGLLCVRSSLILDNIGRITSGAIALTWALGASFMAYTSSLVTAPLLLSLGIMFIGIVYIASTHPLKTWHMDHMKTTSTGTWAVAIIMLLATAWLWLYASFALSTPETPLNRFMWQLALIGGGSTLFAISLVRGVRHAHSLSRRLLASASFTALAASLYFQSNIIDYFVANKLDAAPYYATMFLIGIAAALTFNRLFASIRYEHKSGIVISLLLIIATGTSLSLLSKLETDGFGVFALSAILTIWTLVYTQKINRPVPTIYKPLKSSSQPKNQNEPDSKTSIITSTATSQASS